MNYVQIDGLRILAVETSLLLALFIAAFLTIHFFPRSIGCPNWCKAILARNSRAVVLVIAMALFGRVLLLPWVGIPQPRINDEYSFLLMGDTFSHFRLTNPTPLAWQHFETFHVNLTPTYHSKYPVAPGLALAFGEIVFHQPWIGIYLTTAILCGAICWTLQAFVPLEWALVGGLLAAFRLAFFSYWMNSYWGGSVAALGGALALGAVVRLFEDHQPECSRVFLASLFAISLLILATSRPYEGLAFSLPLLTYFCYNIIRGKVGRKLIYRTIILPAVVIGVIGLGLMAYYNKRTTGHPMLLPHLLNEHTYSPLPLFVWQKPKANFEFRDPVFAKFFAVTEKDYGYEKEKSLFGLWSIEGDRLFKNWFFYCDIALSFPMFIGFLSSMRTPRLRIAVIAAVVTAVALGLCTYNLLQYAAPITVTSYIFAAEGMRYLWQQEKSAEQAFVVAACLTVVIASLVRQTGSTFDTIYGFPNTRDLVIRRLKHEPGKQLVLVSYDLERHYPGNELVHNGANFESEKILWARSKGVGKDFDLCSAYSDRMFWSVITDDKSYSLRRLDLCSDD